jgi:cystathionine beta-lyase
MKKKQYKQDTEIVHLGRAPEEYYGMVNPPVVKASSIIYNSYEEYQSVDYKYARSATPLSEKLEEAMAKLEGGYNAITASSGFSAITTTLLAFLKAGDHLLMTDSVYPPTRHFCDDVLQRFGVQVEYYAPTIGKDIEKLIRKNTKVIYMESPGSSTFEMIDVPTVVVAAKKKSVITIFDNSWSGGVLYKPFKHGVNIIVQSLTKYVGGHSDIMLGVAITDIKKNYDILKETANNLGVCGGSDECYLALRGLRTIKLRLKQHASNAMKVALWLEKQPKVQRVFYPALPSHATHKIWKRDFTGANGLLSVLFKPMPEKAIANFANALELFPVANSWGGYESLLQPQDLSRRTVKWKEKGALLRLHIGLEDPDDLIADLAQALKKLK